MNKLMILIATCIIVQACTPTDLIIDSEMDTTEISTLNSNADSYHNTFVKVGGYMIVERENCVLWSSKDAYERGELNESIWLLFVDGTCYSQEKLNHWKSRVSATLVGKFNAKHYGHLGIYPSAIQNFVILPDVQ